MSTVTIYGFSDDLVEVEGDVTAEYGVYDAPAFALFDDGTKVRAEYAPEGYGAKWRLEPVKIAPGRAGR